MQKLFYILIFTLPFVVSAQIKIENPLRRSGTFEQLITNVASIIRVVTVPLAAVAISVVGFRFVIAIASGKAEEIAKTKKILLWVVVGSAIIVGSRYIADVIVNFAGQL
jgi:hypothetical protein